MEFTVYSLQFTVNASTQVLQRAVTRNVGKRDMLQDLD
jgi:hypothetical protein